MINPSQNLKQRPALWMNTAPRCTSQLSHKPEPRGERKPIARAAACHAPRLLFREGEFMTQQQIEKRRKWFFIGISLLATAITLASFGATYSINMKSFADWGDFKGSPRAHSALSIHRADQRVLD